MEKTWKEKKTDKILRKKDRQYINYALILENC